MNSIRRSFTIISNTNIINIRYNNKVILNQIKKRDFGITDSIMGFANNRVEKNKEKQFNKMLNEMVSAEKWNLRHWKQSIESQLNSWVAYIPGVSNSNEMKDVKKFKTILDAMTPLELDNTELINGIAIERISKQSNQPVDVVGKMIYFYKQTLMIHTWLRLKQANFEKLPDSEIEMMEMQENDPRIQVIAKKIFYKQGKRSGRGRSLPV